MKKEVIYGKSKDGKKLTSQWEFVLDWLMRKPGRTLTSKEAIERWGFTRLSAIVFSIEKHTGITLKREDIEVKTRFGAKTYVTQYWYKED